MKALKAVFFTAIMPLFLLAVVLRGLWFGIEAGWYFADSLVAEWARGGVKR